MMNASDKPDSLSARFRRGWIRFKQTHPRTARMLPELLDFEKRGAVVIGFVALTASLGAWTGFPVLTGLALAGLYAGAHLIDDKRDQPKKPDEIVTWTNEAGQTVTGAAMDKFRLENVQKRIHEIAGERETLSRRQNRRLTTLMNEASGAAARIKVVEPAEIAPGTLTYTFARTIRQTQETRRLAPLSPGVNPAMRP